ncbi:MAG TPA: amidohydrolase family protein [Actinomycetota bacterium]|nr:amidohydrolase family protein [Actinomycetota bacterium]
MTRTLFTGGTIRRLPAAATAEWLLVEGGRVRALGIDDPPDADRTIDLDGGWLLPAFCDAHVHLPITGLYETWPDFRGETSADAILNAFKERAAAGNEMVFGGNFEEPLDRSLSRHDLDAVVGDRPSLLARADLHSCIVSTALLDRLDIDGLEGVDRDEDGAPTGFLREKASATAWTWFDRNLPEKDQRAALHAAVKLAYSKGIAAVHEMFVVEWRGWPSLGVFLETVGEVALKVLTYCATDEVKRVKRMGFPRIGGDYFLDGAFGSHTAWLGAPYLSAPPAGTPATGIAYRTDEELLDFFMEGQHEGLQVGVHAIGDAAIEQAIGTWEKVADKVGIDDVRNLGHRIEHFECASDDHIARAAQLGLRASVQPAFDRLWGGPTGLYAQRMGWDRAKDMNRFGSMLNASLMIGAGSDSTVTPMDPFLQLASLREHHLEEEGLGKIEALRVHTMGSHALAGGSGLSGTVEPGAPADLVWLDRDPGSVDVETLLDTQVRGTWVEGSRVWPEAEAEMS